MARRRQGGCSPAFFWLQFPAFNPNLNLNPDPGCTKTMTIRIKIKNSPGGPEKLGQKKVAIIAVWPKLPLFEGLTERAGVDSMAAAQRSSKNSKF
jgi:hypothetical protein